jgi:hypothetical protein
MKSIVAFSQCFIMGVNLRLIQKTLEEDLLFPGERVLCRSASLIVVIARK